MNPLKNIADMWRDKWAPKQHEQHPYPGYEKYATTDHRWYIWIPLIIMSALMLLFFFLWYFKETAPATSDDKKFKKADEKLQDAQAQLVREIAEVDDEIERNDKEAEEDVAAIDSADDDELLSIYNRLRAEHSGRNASGEENQ